MSEQRKSIIHLAVVLTKKELESTINELIKDVIFEDDDMDDDGLMIKAEKAEAITVEIKADQIVYRVPIKTWLKKDIGITNAEGVGAIAIELSTFYKIESGWQIKTKTEVVHYEWLNKPKVKLGFLDVSVKFIADQLLKRSKALIGQTIDEQLAAKFNLHSYVSKGWDSLKNANQLSDQAELWLRLKATGVSMTPLIAQADKISSKLLLETGIELFLGEKPPVQEIHPLPPFAYSETDADHFLIQPSGQITYHEAENLLKKGLLHKTFKSGTYTTKIEDLRLQGVKDQLMVDVRLSGTYNGSVSMSGRPIYNREKNEVTLDKLKFDFDTKNIIFKSLGWLFRSQLERQLTQMLTFPLVERLEQLKALANEKLKNHPINDRIRLDGDIQHIEIERIDLMEDHIALDFKSEGKLKLLVGEFQLSSYL